VVGGDGGLLVDGGGSRVVVLGGDHDEGGLVGLGRVLRLPLVRDVGVEARVVVSLVLHDLRATVGELDLVGALDGVAVTLLVLAEVQALVGVVHAVREVVWLGGLLVFGLVGVDGDRTGDRHQAAQDYETQTTRHLDCRR